MTELQRIMMITIPSFLLRRLYVKGSLKNIGDGIEFQLDNKLRSGFAHKMENLTVDGEIVAQGDSSFEVNGTKTLFSDISPQNTFTIAFNKTITVRVKNIKLTTDPHKIGMGFEVAGLGILEFDFVDTPSND